MTTYFNFYGVAMRTSGAASHWLYASSGSPTVNGLAGNNLLGDGGVAGAVLVGGTGDNTYNISATGPNGGSSTVIKQAATGINTVQTWANFTLPANIQVATVYNTRTLTANGQGDLLFAANAGGTIVSGAGADVIVGAASGGDTFVFGANSGHDVVYSFIGTGSTHDTVSLKGYNFSTFSQVQSALVQQGANVLLTLDANDAILFANTTVSNFAAGDFLLSAASSSSAAIAAPPSPPPPTLATVVVAPPPPPPAATVVLAPPPPPPPAPSHYSNFYGVAMKTSAAATHWLDATAAGQTLVGLAGANQLSDESRPGAVLIGGSGDNTYSIGATSPIPDESGTVIQQPASGTNTVNAWANYALPANIEVATAYGAHTVVANSQGDLLFAGNANASLVAGSGDDVLVGNSAGADKFVFNPNTGHDAVYTFMASGPAHDVVQLNGYGFTSFAQVQAAMTQQGADVLLTLDANDAVLFRNTTVAAFNAGDFLLSLNQSKLAALAPSFDDEFNSLSLYNAATKTGVWKTSYWFNASNLISDRTLPANGEKEVYVDPSFAGSGGAALGLNPFQINNGVVSIVAQPTPVADLSALGGYKYASGLLTTEKSFSQQYGYFEVKAELPSGKGMWPAFWLLPSDCSVPGEIDVFEQVGGNTLYQTVHSGVAGVTQLSNYIPNLTSGYHTFGLLWTAESITWYVDGTATFTTPTPSDLNKPMYMLLNLAVGGSWPGDPSASTQFPADFNIDYVHAYTLQQMNSMGSGAPVQAFTGTGVNDTFLVDNSADTVIEPVNTGTNTVQAAVSYVLPANVQNLTMIGTDGLSGTGNGLNNVITANSGDDVLNGLGGANTLVGGSGHDTFVFNTLANKGTDTVQNLTRLDTVDMSAYYAAGHQAVVSNSGSDSLLTFDTGEVIRLVGVSSAHVSIDTHGILHMI
jgi:beta-glucanase (GH16 family)